MKESVPKYHKWNQMHPESEFGCSTPYRKDFRAPGEEFPPLSTEFRKTIKRPFIIPLGFDIQRTQIGVVENGRVESLRRRTWYQGVGCSVFQGLCINQASFKEIDCAACLRATFESFILGCNHREVYVDQHGTRRCKDCKDELGQDEPDDPPEEDDFLEEDDPAGGDDEKLEYDDPDILLNRPGMENYRSWNIEGKWCQVDPAGEADLDQTFKEPTEHPLDRQKGGGPSHYRKLKVFLGTEELSIHGAIDRANR